MCYHCLSLAVALVVIATAVGFYGLSLGTVAA